MSPLDTRLDRRGLLRRLRQVDRVLEGPVTLILVGGAAALLLVEKGRMTRMTLDLDAMAGPDDAALEHAIERLRRSGADLPLSARSDAFEAYLPPDWRERVVEPVGLRLRKLRVLVPAAEDLACMKVFSFREKDRQDIQALAKSPGFDLSRFRAAFEATLPAAVGGDPRHHAQSFVLAWNDLVPDAPVRIEDVIRKRA